MSCFITNDSRGSQLNEDGANKETFFSERAVEKAVNQDVSPATNESLLGMTLRCPARPAEFFNIGGEVIDTNNQGIASKAIRLSPFDNSSYWEFDPEDIKSASVNLGKDISGITEVKIGHGFESGSKNPNGEETKKAYFPYSAESTTPQGEKVTVESGIIEYTLTRSENERPFELQPTVDVRLLIEKGVKLDEPKKVSGKLY